MSRSISGSGACRAAAIGLLCVCALVARIPSAAAQEMMSGDDGSSFVSDGAMSPMNGDGGCYGGSCDGGYGGDCYGGCNPCDSCGYNSCTSTCDSGCCSGWFGAEYLRWRLDGGDRTPPLVTAGPVSAGSSAALLDQMDTVVLAGDEKLNDDWRDGYRFFGGLWLDCCHTCGIGFDYFDVGNDNYNSTSPQDPSIVVGRPFFNTETGMEDLELVSVPDELDGTAQVKSNDGFRGAGATANMSVWRCCDPCCPGNSSGVSVLGGYRFYDFDSNLSITERLLVLPNTTTPLVPGTTFLVHDSFRTENEFHGGEIGLQGYKKRCWWWVDGMAKVALGANHRTVRINGRTITDVPNSGMTVDRGGLLTSEVTNIGSYSDTDFAVIPEFRLGLGVCVTKCCSVRAGYNVIYWGDVARASSQLPPGLAVDPRNIPPVQNGGGAEPIFAGIDGSELIAHGFDASVQFQW